MASSLILTVETKADAFRYVGLEKYVASLFAVGKVSAFEGAEAGDARVSLAPFLKPEVLEHEVALNYLMSRTPPLSSVKASRTPITGMLGKSSIVSQSLIRSLR